MIFRKGIVFVVINEHHTYDLQIPLTTSHWVSVNLTHVPSTVRFLHVFYVQVPRTVVVETKRNTWILCDYVVVYGEDCLRVDTYPSHLHTYTDKSRTIIICHRVPLDVHMSNSITKQTKNRVSAHTVYPRRKQDGNYLRFIKHPISAR